MTEITQTAQIQFQNEPDSPNNPNSPYYGKGDLIWSYDPGLIIWRTGEIENTVTKKKYFKESNGKPMAVFLTAQWDFYSGLDLPATMPKGNYVLYDSGFVVSADQFKRVAKAKGKVEEGGQAPEAYYPYYEFLGVSVYVWAVGVITAVALFIHSKKK